MTRVTIVSPNHAVRVRLHQMLVGQPTIQVTGEAVRLSDVDPEETEVAVLASVSSVQANAIGEIGILFLTDDIELARSLLTAGIHGWGVLSPEVGTEELAAGIAAVGEGLGQEGDGDAAIGRNVPADGDAPVGLENVQGQLWLASRPANDS